MSQSVLSNGVVLGSERPENLHDYQGCAADVGACRTLGRLLHMEKPCGPHCVEFPESGNGIVCKGSMALGSACGTCARCQLIGCEIITNARQYLNDQTPKNWAAVNLLNEIWGKFAGEWARRKPKLLDREIRPATFTVLDSAYPCTAWSDGVHIIADGKCRCGMCFRLVEVRP